MRSKRGLLVPALTTALLLAAVLPTAALDAPIQEAGLNPDGMAYEVNRDAAGHLYLSDYVAGDIWVVDPETGAYHVYEEVIPTVSDARPDTTGRIWWVESLATFGWIDPPAEGASAAQVTSWALPGVETLWGLALDGAGRVWLPEFEGAASVVYRFDPVARELCTYAWEGGASSYYALAQNGTLWLGNWEADRIQRLDPSSNLVTYWEIHGGGEPVDIEPVGLALDAQGQLWWAEWELGALGRLEPEAGRITLYPLPVGTCPQMIAHADGHLAYAEDCQGTVGLLDPAQTGGSPAEVVSGTLTAEVLCQVLGPGETGEVAVRSGVLDWTDSSATTVADEDGWLIYGMPLDSAPYGVAESQGYLWASDPGRQKLVRFPLPSGEETWTVYLPLVVRGGPPAPPVRE